MHMVGFFFDLGNFAGERKEAVRDLRFDLSQQRHSLGGERCGLHDLVTHHPHFGFEFLDLEQEHGFAGLVHLVDGIIHRRDKPLDIAAVEGRDETAADGLQNLMADRVGFFLLAHQGLAQDCHIGPTLQQFAQASASPP